MKKYGWVALLNFILGAFSVPIVFLCLLQLSDFGFSVPTAEEKLHGSLTLLATVIVILGINIFIYLKRDKATIRLANYICIAAVSIFLSYICAVLWLSISIHV